MFPKLERRTMVLVTLFDEKSFKYSVEIARQLRELKIDTEIYPDFAKVGKQFKYADKCQIPYVIVAGPDEFKAKEITIKNMRNGKQEVISLKDLSTWVKTKIKK